MGDLIQFTTRPNHSSVYYKFTSQAINFEIKGHGNACIELSKKSGGAEYCVVIGHNRNSWIKSYRGGSRETSETPNILSENEFRKFWISWYSNRICFGRDGETKPLITMKGIDTSKLSNVLFSTFGNDTYPTEWIIELPPQLEKPLRKPVTGGELYWARMGADKKLPDNACIAGFENEPLFIIRAEHYGSLTPGKFFSSKRLGIIGRDWIAHPKDSLEVLCGYDYTWVPSKYSEIPAGAVVGGYSENITRENLYIGRAKHSGHIIPGKVQTSHGTCFITHADKEISVSNYEIMVVPEKVRCVSKHLKVAHYDDYDNNDDDNDDNYYESENESDDENEN